MARIFTIREISEIVKPIAEAYGVERIYVFGSYARGSATEDSDIDLVVSAQAIRGIRIGRFWRELSDAFGVEVDMIEEENESEFVNSIRDEMVLVYQSPCRRIVGHCRTRSSFMGEMVSLRRIVWTANNVLMPIDRTGYRQRKRYKNGFGIHRPSLRKTA